VYEIAPAVTGMASINWAMSIFPETTVPVINPITNRAYVGSSGIGSTIDVFSSGGRLGTVAGLTVDQGRWGFGARHNNSNTFYFVNGASDVTETVTRPGTLAAINGATDSVSTIVDTIGQPFGIGVNQARQHVYVAGLNGVNAAGVQEPGRIAVHDGVNPSNFVLADTSAFASFATFGRQIEVLNDRAYVMVLSAAPNPVLPGSPASVAYLDGDNIPGTHVAQPLIFPAPFGNNDRVEVIRVNPTNNFVYFGLFNAATNVYNVVAMDRATHTVQATFTGGGHSRVHTASWLAVNPATNRLYVLNYNTDTIQALDATTLAPMGAPVALPDGPSAMALNLSANRVYVSSIDAKQLTALDGTTLAVLSTIELPLQAFFLAVGEGDGRVFTGGGNSQDESGYMVVPDSGGVLGTAANVTSVTAPANGAVALMPDNSIVYTPLAGFSGDDTFTYTTTTAAGSSTATVKINVLPAIESAIAVDDTLAMAPAAPSLVIPRADLLKNDVGASGATIQIVSGPSHGSLIDSAVSPGGYDYVPTAAYSGPDSFQYTFTGSSNVATVSIWVTPATSPLVVTNTSDSGAGSLRSAITFANGNPGADTISFNIPGAGSAAAVLINLSSSLPQVTDAVTIDGRTQPGYSGSPAITVRGSSTTSGWAGLMLVANNITVAGLGFSNFADGILSMQAVSNHVVRDSVISGNLRGIQWRSSNGHIYRNVISGNGEGLILNFGAGANRVEENRIGMAANGLTPIPNAGNGVVLYDGVAGTRFLNNIISGNGGWGVDIQHSGVLAPVTGTVFHNNMIGLDINGDLVAFAGSNIAGTTSFGPFVDFGPEFRGNRSGGVHVNNGPMTYIGEGISTGNVISGNGFHGILVDNTPSPGVVIRGNIIGLDPGGNNHRGNTRNGISLVSSVATIGGSNSGEGNVVSGNILNGIFTTGAAAIGTSIFGNKIGTNLSGVSISDGVRPLGNGMLTNPDFGCCHAGIFLGTTGNGVVNNVISGNMIGVRSTTASGGAPNVIADNFIGTGTGGGGALGNAKGVFLAGDLTGSQVVRNMIFYNLQEGVLIAEGSVGAVIGGTVSDANNIGLNVQGVVVGYNASASDTNHVITFNQINNNTDQGIDIGNDGPTPNDAGDVDGGPNGLQNYPVIAAATLGTGTDITLDTTSFANTSHTVHFYSVPTCDANGYGEGATYIGLFNVTAPGIVNVGLPTVVPAGYYVTATATGPNGTSEFSSCRQVLAIQGSISSVTPSPFATGFGQLVTIEGTSMPAFTSSPDQIIFSQGTNSWPATYAWQVSASRVIVRAPTELVPGVPTTVRVTNGAVHSTPPFNVSVSTVPGAPTLHSVHAGSCTGGFNGTPITTTTAGADIVIDSSGVDSFGGATSFVWTPLTPAGAQVTTGAATCGGPSGRVYTTTVVPSYPAGTPVRLEVRTTTAGGTSATSNGIILTIEGSDEGQLWTNASGTFSGGVVVPAGYAMTALRGTLVIGAIEGVNTFARPLAYPMDGSGEVNNFTFGGNTGSAYDLSCPASMVMTGITGTSTGMIGTPGQLTQLSVECKSPSALSGPVTVVGPVGTPSAFPLSVSCSAGKKVIVVQGQVSSIMHGIGVICR
jgi:hypothetical protein